MLLVVRANCRSAILAYRSGLKRRLNEPRDFTSVGTNAGNASLSNLQVLHSLGHRYRSLPSATDRSPRFEEFGRGFSPTFKKCRGAPRSTIP